MTPATEPAPAAIAAGALHRLGTLKGARQGSAFTSDLSVNELLLVLEAGFRPVGLVLGSSVYHVGSQSRAWRVNQELDVLSHALTQARELAMTRMRTQAKGLNADGIVGMRLQTRADYFGSENAEFIAIGTAVKAEPRAGGGQRNWRTHAGQPFTSNLSGQDFCALIRGGYAPLGMVVGSCVYHIAHQQLSQVLANLGRNAEIEPITRAMYEARELAMSRLHAATKALSAQGIVGMELTQHSHSWDSHTTEFLAVGTAIRPLRDNHQIERPAMVLNLDR
jgi:uncharacterized protein YbjQ (UPF0145 family)